MLSDLSPPIVPPVTHNSPTSLSSMAAIKQDMDGGTAHAAGPNTVLGVKTCARNVEEILARLWQVRLYLACLVIECVFHKKKCSSLIVS